MVEELLAFNTKFVEEKQYEQYATSKYPDKKIAILSCMDTRLTELLPAALGLKNGDVKIIKNAGATITQPFGSAVRENEAKGHCAANTGYDGLLWNRFCKLAQRI